MFKSRYFYYLIFLNMLANIIVFVPRILIDNRKDGAVMAILIAIPIGLLMAYLFAKFMSKVPRKDVKEILDEAKVSKWISRPLLIYLIIIWFSAGIIALLAFTDITKRFINPDIDVIYIAMLFLVFVSWSSALPSKKVLYVLELILLVNLPLTSFIFFKAFVNDNLSWMNMLEAGTHIGNIPTIHSIAAATYVFTGYINLVIFNRLFSKGINLKYFWLLIPVGFGVLFTTYFLPIGYYGFDGIGEFTYPWLSTADAIRIKFFFVERVFFIFLLMYVGISLINVIVHWHVGLEMIKSLLPKKVDDTKGILKWVKLDYLILSFFSILYLYIQFYVDELTVFKMSEWWLVIRLPSEYIGALFIIFIIWRNTR
ncbi:GerAB/ArcD/ProY family transporter [Cytobacillus sp. FJAT-54145]|uniref:GerAB/ArcD/ProY family transporter n=1 Tax=Cytobacillus spartinae TaxID=3299023 RepID=A0ABW6K8J0_9BACI